MNTGQDIKEAVERAAGMAAMHKGSVPIAETLRGNTVWQGMVEVFALAGSNPSTAYGWAVTREGKTEFVAILGTPPVNSPGEAVRAWLGSLSRK